MCAVAIHIGDCRDILKTLPDESVQCCITSPPYFGLRDYSTESQVWGGDADCEHVWGDEIIKHSDGGPIESMKLSGGKTTTQEGAKFISTSVFCQSCGAWRGSLGLEPTPEMYVEHLTKIFREVKRVLRDDGTLWLNLGSSYAGSWGNYHPNSPPGKHGQRLKETARWNRPAYNDQAFLLPTANTPGFKPKDLIPIPWMVAMALQADGWWLRRDIIWAKGVSFLESYAGSSMPESAQDRPTTSHEYVFLLTKSAHYFYDIEAVKEASIGQTGQAANFARDTKESLIPGQLAMQHRKDRQPTRDNGKRNLRSVWVINPQGFSGAHFATFPPALVEPMILAGTSEKGCCPECGAAWERVTEKRETGKTQKMADGWDTDPGAHGTIHRDGRPRGETDIPVTENITVGWQPTCECGESTPDDVARRLEYPLDSCSPQASMAPIPCTVLDPFAGVGTVGLVADRLQRDAILIELSRKYAEMSYDRIQGEAPMFVDVVMEQL